MALEAIEIGYDYDKVIKAYPKDEADRYIAELKAENDRLTIDKRNEELRADQADATVETLKENLRATKRALWIARANRANAEWGHWATIWFCNTSVVLNINKSSVSQDPYRCTIQRNAAIWRNMWNEVEHKCRAKAEEYK